jgi:hypothetical protein
MICLIALVVFGILGIFSAAYRKVAREAFDCVFRRITLRKCETGLDQRIKSKMTSKLSNIPRLARFFYRHFEAISWFFTILMIVSLIFSVQSVYNLAVHGTCDPNSPGECVISYKKAPCTNENCAQPGCSCTDSTCTCVSSNCTQGAV